MSLQEMAKLRNLQVELEFARRAFPGARGEIPFFEKIGIISGVSGKSDNYYSVKLEPMRESDPRWGQRGPHPRRLTRCSTTSKPAPTASISTLPGSGTICSLRMPMWPVL